MPKRYRQHWYRMIHHICPVCRETLTMDRVLMRGQKPKRERTRHRHIIGSMCCICRDNDVEKATGKIKRILDSSGLSKAEQRRAMLAVALIFGYEVPDGR